MKINVGKPYTGPLRRKWRDAPERRAGETLIPDGLRRAQYALQQSGPMPAAELDEYNRLRAREMARAEARRKPSPQLELGDAA